MDLKQIDEVLRAMPLAGRAGVNDAGFRRAVWREIRHRRALGETSLQKESLFLVMRRGLFAPTAIAGLAAAILVAWVIGVSWESREFHQTDTTARVLDLRVFSPQADGYAHGKLVVNR